MLARAPGKLVLSGAYAVLEGAPAIITAVDRFVVADSSKAAQLTTPEFGAATQAPQPYFDASRLRQHGRKLGLGSSAAILVACLGALSFSEAPDAPTSSVRQAVYTRALAAHRLAQGGGSGIDVAASVFGGTLLARRAAEGTLGHELDLSPLQLPNGLVVQVWATGQPASTSELVARVMSLKFSDKASYAKHLGAQAEAAHAAAQALQGASAGAFIEALANQHRALDLLGAAAGAELVVDAVRQLHRTAQKQGAAVLPAGAGGGDISVYVGLEPPSKALILLAGRLGQKPLDLELGAPGLMRLPSRQITS